MRIVLGNVLFAALVAGWYWWVGGNAQQAAAGVILAFAAFVTGMCLGSWVSSRPLGRGVSHRSMPRLRHPDPSVFNHIQ
jgi:hypothetical protein